MTDKQIGDRGMKKDDCQHVYYGQWILVDGEFKHYNICAKCGSKKESEGK